MSLIEPVFPTLKMGSPPDTENAVAVPAQAGALPEKAMQGVLLDTANKLPAWLPLIKSPLPVIGMGEAKMLAGAIAINAIPIEAKPPILRPAAKFLYLLILFIFFSSSQSIRDVIPN